MLAIIISIFINFTDSELEKGALLTTYIHISIMTTVGEYSFKIKEYILDVFIIIAKGKYPGTRNLKFEDIT